MSQAAKQIDAQSQSNHADSFLWTSINGQKTSYYIAA